MKVIATITGLQFLDFTFTGSMVVATIFNDTNDNGEYFYVTSRHISVLGNSLPSQYTGFCKIIELNQIK